MKFMNRLRPIALVTAVFAVAGVGYATRERWVPRLEPAKRGSEPIQSAAEAVAPTGKVIVNEQAQLNLGLTAKPLKAQTYWKTIPVPGMVVDRPGLSDRGVVAPVTGVVLRVHRVPGDTIKPGDPLFTFKLASEPLHQTQTELFKAAQDVKLVEADRKRLAALGDAVSGARVIEKDNELARLRVAIRAYRQELANRGFGADLIEGVTEGKFINEITISVPARTANTMPSNLPTPESADDTDPLRYEVQELKVEPGQQVQAGQTLCTLANHQLLAVEGRAFRDETPLLERSVREGWPVEVDFQEESADWPPVEQTFLIRQLANTIDPNNRTFAFLLPLENQSRVVQQPGRMQTLWRFRPGQKVKLLVRVEEIKNVFVLPADAVARDGPEAFLFTQNVNTFERRQVRVLLQDRQRVVVANDGSLPAGIFAVQNGAAQLNRLIKAGGASGVPKGYHVHADGSLHKNEDEGK